MRLTDAEFRAILKDGTKRVLGDINLEIGILTSQYAEI